jgi:hypothetical protein
MSDRNKRVFKARLSGDPIGKDANAFRITDILEPIATALGLTGDDGNDE